MLARLWKTGHIYIYEMLLNITYIFYIHDSFLFLVILIILRDTLLPGPLGSLSPGVYAVELPRKRLLVTNKMCVCGKKLTLVGFCGILCLFLGGFI